MKTRSLAPVLLAVLAPGCRGAETGTFIGFVDAPISAVASEVAGRMETVSVREGDHVKKGDVLAQLDSREREAGVEVASANVERARAQLRTAEENLRVSYPTERGAGADVARAQATLDDAQTNFDRAKQLFGSGASTKADLDSASARLREALASFDSLVAGKEAAHGRVAAAVAAVADASAALKSTEAALALASVQLAQEQIVAPFDGIVVDRNLEPGEWAAPGTAVVTLEDRSRLWVRVDVEETRFSGLQVGMPAEIRTVALGNRTLHGHVIEIGAEGDFAINRDVKRGRPDIRTFRVRVSVDEAADELRPGLTAEVHLAGAAGASDGRQRTAAWNGK